MPDNGKLVDGDNQLPHHLAVTDNTPQSEEVLKLLFQYKFDLSTVNKSRETALQCCRKDREHLKKLLKEKINEKPSILEFTSENVKEDLQQKQNFDYVSNQNATDTVKVIAADSKKVILPPENDIASDSDDEMSTDELAEIVKKKVEHVLKKEHCLKDTDTSEAESQKGASSIPHKIDKVENTIEDTVADSNEDWKQFEECSWEVECTETFWKELAKQEKSLKRTVFSKLFRLAKGEWHRKFRKPLSGTKFQNLYEIKLTDSARIIWELAITYSPRLSYQNKSEYYTEVIRVWCLVVNHDHIDAHIEQIEKANIRDKRV